MWMINSLCYITLIFSTYNFIRFTACCEFPEHWIGNWYQAGIRITVTIEKSKISSKGICLDSEGDKYLMLDSGRACYRCIVIHEKHYNVLQYKETFCQNGRTLRQVCLHLSGDQLLYSMFREVSQSISCPFNPPYTFSYSRGRGECMHPPSTIDMCTDNTRFLIHYQACHDVHGSESALEQIECFAVWKESSYRYLVGKVIQEDPHNKMGEHLYRCFVFEKPSPMSSEMRPALGIGSANSTRRQDADIEYKLAQSGDATCSGLFSPAEASITMTLRRNFYNWTCKFPTWMLKRRYWHTLDYGQSYSFNNDDSTLTISNISTTLRSRDSEEDNRKSETRITCVENLNTTEQFAQLIARYLNKCRQGFICVLLYRRSEHIIEIQTGSLSKRPEDACSSRYFHSTNSPFITLVTPEPETKVCPFFGNFVVNGVSRLGKDGLNENIDIIQEKRSDRQSRLSTVDIMGTYTDNLLQDYFQSSIDNRQRSQIHAKQKRSTSAIAETSGMIGAIRSLTVAEKNATVKNGTDNSFVSRGKRLVSNSKKSTCVLNFNKILFGCRSPDTMEFRSDCPLFSSDIISVFLCHGSWLHNISHNSSIHYLVTTPLSRTSKGVRRYCFMYQTNENSSTIQFTSSSDTCHRGLASGIDGIVTFNITPVHTGKCAGLVSNSSQKLSVSKFSAQLLLVLFVYSTLSNG